MVMWLSVINSNVGYRRLLERHQQWSTGFENVLYKLKFSQCALEPTIYSTQRSCTRDECLSKTGICSTNNVIISCILVRNFSNLWSRHLRSNLLWFYFVAASMVHLHMQPDLKTCLTKISNVLVLLILFHLFQKFETHTFKI